MIKERIEDITFMYLYIKDFKWNNTMASETYVGHPRVGEVYRGLYNSASGNYKILLPAEGNRINTFVFKSLNVEGDECSGKIEKISKSNIVKLDLKEEQLDRLLEWMDKKNSDIKSVYEPKAEQSPEVANIVNGLMNLREAINEYGTSELEAKNRANAVFSRLYMTNTTLFELLLEIAECLHQYDMSRMESPHLLMGISSEGKGINIQQALMYLEEYMSPVKEGGDYRESIIDAICHLVTELERRYVCEED